MLRSHQPKGQTGSSSSAQVRLREIQSAESHLQLRQLIRSWMASRCRQQLPMQRRVIARLYMGAGAGAGVGAGAGAGVCQDAGVGASVSEQPRARPTVPLYTINISGRYENAVTRWRSE